MEQRMLTDPLLKMTPVVVLQRLPAGFRTTSWRKLAARPLVQRCCTGVPMSLPIYRRRRQPLTVFAQQQNKQINKAQTTVKKSTRRTKRRSRSLPAKKLQMKHVDAVVAQGSQSDTAVTENIPNTEEESSLCDSMLQGSPSFKGSDYEESSSTYESHASSTVSLESLERSEPTSVSDSDTEIDDDATFHTSSPDDSNDTIAATVTTDSETDMDVESRNVDADGSACLSQESSQNTIVTENGKQVVTDDQSSETADAGEKRVADDESVLSADIAENGCPTCMDSECAHEEEVTAKTSDPRLASTSPDPASLGPLTTGKGQLSAEDEIDAFTADVIETMLDVHVNSLPTFVQEYFHNLKACFEVLSSMQEADKNAYSRMLCYKRDSLRRIFQILRELRRIVDYPSSESVLTLERQFSNFLSVAGLCVTGKQVYSASPSDILGCGNVQQNAVVSDCPQAQRSTPSSLHGGENMAQNCSAAPLQCASPMQNTAGGHPNHSPFPPRSSPFFEPSKQCAVQSSSPAANFRVAHGAQITQLVCSTNQSQQPQPAVMAPVRHGVMLYTSTTLQPSHHQPQTVSSVAGDSQHPCTLVVRSACSLPQTSDTAQKHALNHCAATTTASTSPMCAPRPASLPQCSSPAVMTNNSVAQPGATSNMLRQTSFSVNLTSNQSNTFAPVPVASLPQHAQFSQPAPLQVRAFSVRPQLPVPLNVACPTSPSVRWMPQRLWVVSSQGQMSPHSAMRFVRTSPASSSSSAAPFNQSSVRNSYPRPNVSNIALVLPPQVRSSMISMQAPVAMMPACQAVVHPVEDATELQNRGVAMEGFNSLPTTPTMNQPRPCITGVVIPVVRSKPEVNVSQNSIVCTIQGGSGSLVPQESGQHEKPAVTAYPAMGPSR